MYMRTTLNIDDSLLRHAAKLTGVKEKTSLVRLGLEALISKESARRLAELENKVGTTAELGVRYRLASGVRTPEARVSGDTRDKKRS